MIFLENKIFGKLKLSEISKQIEKLWVQTEKRMSWFIKKKEKKKKQKRNKINSNQ